MRHPWNWQIEVLLLFLVSGAVSEHGCERVFFVFFLLLWAESALEVLVILQVDVFLQVVVILDLDLFRFLALLLVFLFRLFFLFELLVLFLQLVTLNLFDNLGLPKVTEFDVELFVE